MTSVKISHRIHSFGVNSRDNEDGWISLIAQVSLFKNTRIKNCSMSAQLALLALGKIPILV